MFQAAGWGLHDWILFWPLGTQLHCLRRHESTLTSPRLNDGVTHHSLHWFSLHSPGCSIPLLMLLMEGLVRCPPLVVTTWPDRGPVCVVYAKLWWICGWGGWAWNHHSRDPCTCGVAFHSHHYAPQLYVQVWDSWIAPPSYFTHVPHLNLQTSTHPVYSICIKSWSGVPINDHHYTSTKHITESRTSFEHLPSESCAYLKFTERANIHSLCNSTTYQTVINHISPWSLF